MLNKWQRLAADIKATMQEHPDYCKAIGDLCMIDEDGVISVCALGAALLQHFSEINNGDFFYEKAREIYKLDIDALYRVYQFSDGQGEHLPLIEIANIIEKWGE